MVLSQLTNGQIIEAYWVVTVDRHTGKAVTHGPFADDDAAETAATYAVAQSTSTVFATVVGAR